MFKKISTNSSKNIKTIIEIKKILDKYLLKNFNEDFENIIVFKKFDNKILNLVIKEPVLAQEINLNKKNIIKIINKKFNIEDINIKTIR